MNELPELMKQIQLIIQKAARSLNASQRNLKEGDYDKDRLAIMISI
jgi:hypothetical protein